MSELINVEVLSDTSEAPLHPDSYDYSRLPPELRDPAMLAQGTVLTKLGGAVERVIDAGNTLRWAKDKLPHGEYLPWVQQACGLKATYASQLVKAAEWVNLQPAESLIGVSTTDTLFLLSADATPEDVREWVMERCAAGNPPTRKEVQDRKRQSQGKATRTLTQEIKAALKLSSEVRQLADKAEHITTRQLMDELDLDDLPKGVEHQNQSHLFLKNGTGWWKVPNEKPVDIQLVKPREQTNLLVEPVIENKEKDLQIIKVSEAAKQMGYENAHQLRNKLTPSSIKRLGNPKGNGWEALPHPKHGCCFIRQTTSSNS